MFSHCYSGQQPTGICLFILSIRACLIQYSRMYHNIQIYWSFATALSHTHLINNMTQSQLEQSIVLLLLCLFFHLFHYPKNTKEKVIMMSEFRTIIFFPVHFSNTQFLIENKFNHSIFLLAHHIIRHMNQNQVEIYCHPNY